MRLQKRQFTQVEGPNRVPHRLTMSIFVIVLGVAAFLIVMRSWRQLVSIWNIHPWLQWSAGTVSIILMFVVGMYWFSKAKGMDRQSLIVVSLIMFLGIVWVLANHQVISNSWSLDMSALATLLTLIFAYLTIRAPVTGRGNSSSPDPEGTSLKYEVEEHQTPEIESRPSSLRKFLISYVDTNDADLALAKQLEAMLRRRAYTPLLQFYQPQHCHSLRKELKLASKEAQYIMLIISQHYLEGFTGHPLSFKWFMCVLSRKREQIILIDTGTCEKHFEVKLARFDPISVVGKTVADVYQELMKRIPDEDVA